MSVDSLVVVSAPRSRIRIFVLAALAAGSIGWFALLGARPLFDPDEGRYAEIPREMLAGAGWIIPHLNGLVYLEKPPLQYWLTAGAMRMFGHDEFAARLITGLAGLLTLLVVHRTARLLWSARAARDAVLLLLGAALFTLMSHQVTLDMLLTFWMTCALACFIRAQNLRDDRAANRHWMLGCWAAMAAAVLTKGLIGALIPAVSLILYSVMQRDFVLYDRLNLRFGIPLFAALSAPWFVAAALQNRAFLEFFFVREHLQRYLTPIEHRMQPWWFFLLVLLAGALPWAWSAARSLARDWLRTEAYGRFDVGRLLWVWSVFTLLFFSASDSKLIPYILPAVPSLALLCARHRPALQGRSILAGMLLTLAAAAAVAVALVIAAHAPQARATSWVVESFRVPLSWMTGMLTVTALMTGRFILRRRPARALAALCLGWCAAVGVLLGGSAAGDALFTMRDSALLLQRRASAADPVFAVGGYDQTMAYYLRRPVTLVAYRDEFDLGLSQEPWRGVDTLTGFVRRWNSLPQGYAWIAAKAWPPLAQGRIECRPIARSRGWLLVSRR
jgi:4-amino-4-deoxy-L-arabinose transferase-like glycosyltransferase